MFLSKMENVDPTFCITQLEVSSESVTKHILFTTRQGTNRGFHSQLEQVR